MTFKAKEFLRELVSFMFFGTRKNIASTKILGGDFLFQEDYTPKNAVFSQNSKIPLPPIEYFYSKSLKNCIFFTLTLLRLTVEPDRADSFSAGLR